MRRLLILLMSGLSIVLCITTSVADDSQFLSHNQGIDSNETIRDSKAYEVYKSHRHISSGEIKYLIHLVKHSNLKVVREGREYSSSQAAHYLNIKYNTHSLSVDTAEEFIDKYASFTKAGDPVYVMDLQGGIVPARQVLYGELRQLREFENNKISRIKL